jgi:hypothetical protein
VIGVELIGSLTSDYLAASGFTLASVGGVGASNTLQRVFHKRAEDAQRILMEELRLGARTEFEIDDEEAVAVVFRFFRAATEGAARLNLGLLGSCIANEARADRLRADLFLRWADVLASLSREEVHLLAAVGDTPRDDDDGRPYWARVEELMKDKFGYAAGETEAFAAAVCRTGCIITVTGYGAGIGYAPSKLFKELHSLVDIDGVVRRYDTP